MSSDLQSASLSDFLWSEFNNAVESIAHAWMNNYERESRRYDMLH